jgi:hypothetical protein
MQTFLPYANFVESARVLDYRRLGKQRVEAKQLLNALRNPRAGWANHPAAKMWRGHEAALRLYHDACIAEWCARGYRNTMQLLASRADARRATMPPWFGAKTFHASHRSNLLRKDPHYYGQFGWREPPDLPYVWPAP